VLENLTREENLEIRIIIYTNLLKIHVINCVHHLYHVILHTCNLLY